MNGDGPQSALSEARTQQRSYEQHLQTVGIDVATLKAEQAGTLVVPRTDSFQITVDSLPRLAVASASDEVKLPPDLMLHDKLGEGGMGLVWLATQVPLDRKVAVKQLRLQRRDERNKVRLLREALVTGMLEHPNVVPVHTLGRGEDGPLIVMKYIEGRSWKESLEPLFGEDGEIDLERTERELGVFTQICNAIHFAHSKGVLHRDIKPDNVMLSSFGEVYVVDWGIAVATRPGGKLPSTEQISGLEGTPSYMAPEMAAADAKLIGKRTDVYLLGATLHELVTGEKRHVSDTLIGVLSTAFASAPHEYDPKVPRELAAIINKACAADPRDRYPDAAALRDAVAEFLRHRSSRRLAEGARERLALLRSHVVQDRSISVDATEVHSTATEARFGFRLAMQEWEDNVDARDGLQETLEVLIDYELSNRNTRAAMALLAELPEARPELAKRVRTLDREVRDERRRVQELEQKEYDADLEIDTAMRRKVAFVLGGVLSLAIGTLYTSRLMGWHEAGYPDALFVTVVFAVAVFACTAWMRRMGANLANLRVMAGIGVCCVALVGVFGLSWVMGVAFVSSLSLAMCVAATTAGSLGVMMDMRMAGGGIVFLLTATGVAVWPETRGPILVVGCFVAFAVSNIAFKRVAEQAVRDQRAGAEPGADDPPSPA